MNYEDFMKAVKGSKQFSFNGSVLELINYNTGDRFYIDFAKIDEDMFEEIIADEETDEW